MSDEPSQSRSPRENGAQTEDAGHSIGDTIRAWLRGLARIGEGDLRESLEEVIEEHEDEGESLDPGQREMLLNILSFGELQADDVMVPRADIVAVEIETPLDELLAAYARAGHSRLPVYRESLDDIVGFIHIKDLIAFWDDGEGFAIEKILREPLVVVPSMLVLELLARMRATRIHMAIVVDEYGGVDGLVTIEDVVEEIVGEIADEHDVADRAMLVELADGSIEADARAEIESFEARFGVDLLPDETDEDIDTLGGMVIACLGRMPRRGEKLRHPAGLEFEVLDADPRRIKKLKVRRLPPAAAEVAD
ncbi:MAG: hemolysin family protein [Alphaproteobacteria bacterium]|jgi:CBS domain containing-hemolysin-like protein|nr:hemolysin family protein [Alphaproteobacteria bacterium]